MLRRRQPLIYAALAVLCALALVVPAALAVQERPADERITVLIQEGYRPNRPDRPGTRELLALMRREPRINIQPWGGIRLPGAANRSSLLMSIAGDTAPDIFYSMFHGIRNDMKQGFLHPLNEWIGTDTDGNGILDDDEVRWDGWKRVPPLWRRVASDAKGNVYGIPYAGVDLIGLAFRKDMVREAGLDPDSPPETWDEFYYWCQRLTYPNRNIPGARSKSGQYGFATGLQPWWWLTWMQSAGGTPVVQIRRSPTTGVDHTFPMEAIDFKAPDTGEDLSSVPPQWRANFDSQAGMQATDFYYKLRWAPWLRDSDTGEPVNLSEADLVRGTVQVGDRTIAFTGDDVIRGVMRVSIGGPGDPNTIVMFARKDAAIIRYNIAQVEDAGSSAGVHPELIGMMPYPAVDRQHKPVFQAHKHYWAMTVGVGPRPEQERDAVWKCLQTLVSEEVRDRDIRERVMSGNAMWCRPDDLRRLGLHEYLNDVPDYIKRIYDRVESGDILLRTEPFAGFWLAASDILRNNVISLMLAETGRMFDHQAALREATWDANNGAMFDRPVETLDRHRPTARVVFGIGVLALAFCVILIVRERYTAPTGSSGARQGRIMPWILLAPALLTIALWSYYPLIRGAVMAFQEYRIVGESRWVGLNNFIAVAIDPNFWLYVGKTFKFVGLTMLFGFCTPILLGFLLAEVPRGKIFFRTLFFLPKMTSGIVIALLWKMLYDPTPNGLLNQVLARIGLPAQTWLQDPFWAMFCCILPGVWAGAGMSCLIYIAAMKSFPDDLYEAAAIDGAGYFRRVRFITLPQLTPLLIINFVGTFIVAFQNMGHIFLLTFGGPGKETMVLGLAIWKLAYNELRFSTATTMAWYLGMGLIGFTYFQIRFLRRLEFRRVEDN